MKFGLLSILFSLMMVTLVTRGELVMATLSQGTISGNSMVCMSSPAGHQYTVTGSSATGGYTWVVPVDAVVTDGAGTNQITVTFGSPGIGQNISVTGNGLSATYVVNVYSPIATAPVISGPSDVCPNQTGVSFTLNNINGFVTQYQWSVPNGVTITSDPNSQGIIVSISGTFTGGNIIGYVIAGPCGSSPVAQKTISASATMPSAPGSISGSTSVLPGQTDVLYTIPQVPNASSYEWSLPTGAALSGSGTGSSILINFASYFEGGELKVRGVNSSCKGPDSAPLHIALATLPGPAGPISGPDVICLPAGGTSATYSIDPVPGATSYLWDFPPGTSPAGNSSLSSVVINFSSENITATGLTLNVRAFNASGYGSPSSKIILLNRPTGPLGDMTGPASVCSGASNVAYSVLSNPNATSYTWTLPQGASFAMPSSSNSCTVNFSSGYSGGSITVVAQAGICESSPVSSKSVEGIATPGAAGVISGPTSVCQGAQNVTFTVPAITNAAEYFWTLPGGQQEVRTTNSITVNFPLSASSGDISVFGRNNGCPGASSSRAISILPAPMITQQTHYSRPSATAVLFNVAVNGSNLTYQWKKDGVDIPGAIASSHLIDPARNSHSGSYWTVITGANGCSISSNAVSFKIRSIEEQTNMNYIVSRSVTKDNITDETEVQDLLADEMDMTIIYFDGLGRSIQNVQWRHSPDGSDIVTPVVYDAAGREDKKYLPFVAETDYGWFQNVTFDGSGNYSGEAANTYGNLVHPDIAQDTRPFIETIFEPSPLGRPLKDFGPGTEWYSQHKPMESSYLSNRDGSMTGTEKVVAWKISSEGLPIKNLEVSAENSGPGFYPSAVLYIKVSRDEQGQEVREYTDKQGRVILKKVQAVENASLNNDAHWAQTYYIYDDLGNLVMVLPPEAVKALTE